MPDFPAQILLLKRAIDPSTTMASLKISFPEGGKWILLRGTHISVGRFPDNTIQIQDRTVSAYHFELYLENDHYRLHDSGSTNGVVIEGRRVQDYHLRVECRIMVGTVLCEFHPGLPMDARPESVELLPVREEVEATRHESHQVKLQNTVLREQIARMLESREEGPSARLDELFATNAALQLQAKEQHDEIEKLAARTAILARDRDNLQRAYDDMSAAVAIARADAAAAQGRLVPKPAEHFPIVAGETVGRATVPLRRAKEAPKGGGDTKELKL